MNKRDFLACGGQTLLGASSLALGHWPAQAMAAGPAGPSSRKGLQHWQALAGLSFTAPTALNLPATLTLAEVRAHPAQGRLEQFTLVFHGPSSRQLLAGLHILAHADHGPHQVYLEPTQHAHGRTVYAAHFSLMT